MKPVTLMLLAFIQMVLVVARIPQGFIFTINQMCGSSTDDIAVITVTTDINADVTAVCRDGDAVFSTTDSVHFSLNVSYPGSSKLAKCVFHKQSNTTVYSVLVVARFSGSHAHPLLNLQEKATVTCSLGQYGHAQSSFSVREGQMTKYEIQGNTGQQTTTNIELFISDIKGHNLTQREIGLGRLVQIVLLSDGAGTEFGIRPNHCDAVGMETGSRYAILVAGCGDGVAMYRTEGFTVEGNKAVSPYFEMFEIQGDPSMTFRCNVTLCSVGCNGNTCPDSTSRRKRSIKRDTSAFLASKKTIVVRSRPIRLDYERPGNDATITSDDSFSVDAKDSPDNIIEYSSCQTTSPEHLLLFVFCAVGFVALAVVTIAISVYCKEERQTPKKINTYLYWS